MKKLLLIFVLFLSGCVANSPVKEKKINPKCLQKGEAGRCRAYIPRYYFDTKSLICKEFIWGGCGGIVPFETMQSCKESCL